MDKIDFVSQSHSGSTKNIEQVLELLSEGSTIPFIARYRKEKTGGMDELDIAKIEERAALFEQIVQRKSTILSKLEEQEINDEQVISRIKTCFDLQQLEDLYLPYKQKRKTKASVAREQGLEPLAKIIMAQRGNLDSGLLRRFTSAEIDEDAALEGARYIISEWISEHLACREQVRRYLTHQASIQAKVVKGKEDEAQKFQDFFDYNQRFKSLPGHRYLAICRGEKEGYLRVKFKFDKSELNEKVARYFVKTKGDFADQVQLALDDALKRLVVPSIENELRATKKEEADAEAIKVFTENVSQLLLEAPLGSKVVLALDPGFRTGCKMVVLDGQGNLKQSETIYPHPPINKANEAADILLKSIEKHKVEAIAIGDGTAGRESLTWLQSLGLSKEIELYMVNESGASIYSASEVGREEFPKLDLTVRGAISIGRRLMDPLSELVKIDPKSIGVGQYQHDVAQDKLKRSLDHTVSFAVNKVGVNANTASPYLLRYISGFGPKLAESFVAFRSKNGSFKSREEFKKVSGLGPKAFEQAAGFLRVPRGDNPLDNTAVHPEAYPWLQKLLAKRGLKLQEIIGNAEKVRDLRAFAVEQNSRIENMEDIFAELAKPSVDPRGAAKKSIYDDRIQSIEDLRVGMEMRGKINNITDFGAFVDLGIKENGLIHKSQIANRYVERPADFLSLNQEVKVRIVSIDLDRKRIGLSMKDLA